MQYVQINHLAEGPPFTLVNSSHLQRTGILITLKLHMVTE